MAENGILDYQGMNQAIYRGATSNIVVDTQSMSIEIGAGNTSHTSNLHFECNHDANVASIKLNSNVTTEFSRSKKLIKYPRVALTQNALNNGYTVSASSQESTNRQAWKVFNNTYEEGDGWRSWGQTYSSSDGSFTGTFVDFSNGGQTFTATDQGQWVKITLPEKMRLERFRLQPRYSPTTGGATYSYGRSEFVKNGAIWGSNDGSSWDKVYTITYGVPATDTTIAEFTVPNSTTAYNNFVLVVTDTHGSSAGLRTGLSEWELLGVPEYDPDAHGTDVTIKSGANVPNTDWLEVYYDAKDLEDGAILTTAGAITGLGGTTNNGTAYGNPQISDGAFDLDGTGDYIITAPIGFTGDQVHSVSLWFWSDKPQSDMTTEHGLYSFGYGNNLHAGLSCWSPVTYPNQTFRFWHAGSGGKNFPGTTFLEDMWNHIVVVYPGDGAFNIRIWLNGVELHGVNNPGNSNNYDFNWSASDTILIGDWYDANGPYGQSSWDGKIANFRLFNRALTTDEIYQLYAYQKEYFGHSTNNLTLKAGRLGIGTSEPRATLDVRGDIYANGAPAFPIPVAAFYKLSASTTNATHDENIQSGWVAFTGANTTTPGVIEAYTLSGGTTTQGTSSGVVVKLCKKGMYKLEAGFAINTQSAINSHIGIGIYPVSDSYIPGNNSRVHYTMGGAGSLAGYFYIPGSTNNINQQFRMTEILRVSEGPGYAYVTMTPNSNLSTHFQFQNWGAYPHGVMYVTYLG